jgi:signal transduction histidine kinase/PAS domain-containing protein
MVEAESIHGMRTSVLILDEDGGRLLHGAAPSLPAAYNEAIDGMLIGEGAGSCGTAAVRGTPVYVDDIATDPLWIDFRELATSHGLAACWSTPIRGLGDRLLGTFAIYYDTPRRPTDGDLEAIASVTHVAALAIERHRTEEELRRRREELRTLDEKRAKSEAALHDSEARLDANQSYWRSAFERLNEGFMIVEVVRDEAGVARTWRFKEINAAWERISGLDQAAARGRNVDDVIPGVEQHWLDVYIGVAETGEPIAMRLALAPLGQLYDVRASRIAPDQVAVLFQEVSEQQREEVRRAALLELHDRLRNLDEPQEVARAAAEALGRALDVDRAGYASVAEEGDTLLIERDWTAAGFPSAAGVHRLADYGEAVVATGTGETIVIPDVVADPRTSAVVASFEAVVTRALVNVPIIEGGRIVAFVFVNAREPRGWTAEEVAFVRNVAELTRAAIERRRAEAELRRLAASLERKVEERTGELIETQAALAQAQKMEAVGQLTGGLAHDFNNLLAGISGSLELIQRHIAKGRLENVDRFVTTARGAVKRAAALTHRLLAFSRRQALDPKPTNINRLIAGLEELVRRTVGPSVRVEVVGAGGLWSTLVDPPQLENALLNLCINARDAMPGGGRLTIETANKWLDDRAASERDLPPGQYVSLCVTDTGVGMPADVVARAFDPFFTTKPLGEGTGLGLSMTYGFARQSGGQVRIYSEVGTGTTVCIYLPRHGDEAIADPDRGLASERPVPGSGRR